MELCQKPALLNLNPLKELWKRSEYPVVVLLFPQHYLMLSRNLLYTELTRAKQLAVIVGPKKAVAMAVAQVKDQKRYTGLTRWFSSAVLYSL